MVRIALAGTMSVSYIEGEDAGRRRWGYAAAAPDAQFVSATEDQEETAVERNLHMRELSLIIFSGPSLYRYRRFEIIFLYKFYSHKNLKG
jgi:hypothetical protein